MAVEQKAIESAIKELQLDLAIIGELGAVCPRGNNISARPEMKWKLCSKNTCWEREFQAEGLCIKPRVNRKLGILDGIQEYIGIKNAWTKYS